MVTGIHMNTVAKRHGKVHGHDGGHCKKKRSCKRRERLKHYRDRKCCSNFLYFHLFSDGTNIFCKNGREKMVCHFR